MIHVETTILMSIYGRYNLGSRREASYLEIIFAVILRNKTKPICLAILQARKSYEIKEV